MKKQNWDNLKKYIVIALVCFVCAFVFYPKTIKVQLSYGDYDKDFKEFSVHIRDKEGYDIGSLSDIQNQKITQFVGDSIVFPIKKSQFDLDSFTTIELALKDRSLDELVPVGNIKASFGNIKFYEEALEESELIDMSDLERDFDENGQPTKMTYLADGETERNVDWNIAHDPYDGYRVTGEEPRIFISLPKTELAEASTRIGMIYTACWTLAFLLLSFMVTPMKNLVTIHDLKNQKNNKGEATTAVIDVVMLVACIAIGIIGGKFLQVINNHFLHMRILQSSEIRVICLISVVIFWMIFRRLNGVKDACLETSNCDNSDKSKYTGLTNILLAFVATAIIAIPLTLAIRGLTTFLTADEQTSLSEHCRLEGDELRHWMEHTSRACYMITGTFFAKLRYDWWESVTKLQYQQVAKLIHGAIGIFALLKAIDLTAVYAVDVCRQKSRSQAATKVRLLYAIAYILLTSLAFLMPSVTIAFKNYNYDTFSLCFGVLGMAYAWRAFHEKNVYYGWMGVIFAAIGLLDKVTAAPLFLVACVMAVYAGANATKVIFGHGILVYLNQYYVLHVLKQDNAPIHEIGDALKVILSRIPVIGRFCLYYGGAILKQFGVYPGFILYTVLMTIVLVVSAWVLKLLVCHLASLYALQKYVAAALLAIFLGLGVILTFVGAPYNEDLLPYLIFVINHYFLSLNTLLVLMLVAAIVFVKKYNGPISIYWGMVFATWGGTLASLYKKKWNPAWFRYLNMFQLMLVLLVVACVILIICDVRAAEAHESNGSKDLLTMNTSALAIVALIVGLNSWEAFPSSLASTYFLPAWYGLTAVNKPVEERTFECYWGEQHAELGEKILAYCKQNGYGGGLDPINIYCGYFRGWWLTEPENVTDVANFDHEWDEHKEDCGQTDHDFYIIDTQAVNRDDMLEDGWPDESMQPIFDIKYRGYTTAKIYRGCDIIDYLEIDK